MSEDHRLVDREVALKARGQRIALHHSFFAACSEALLLPVELGTSSSRRYEAVVDLVSAGVLPCDFMKLVDKRRGISDDAWSLIAPVARSVMAPESEIEHWVLELLNDAGDRLELPARIETPFHGDASPEDVLGEAVSLLGGFGWRPLLAEHYFDDSTDEIEREIRWHLIASAEPSD